MVALVIKGDNSRATLTKKNFLDRRWDGGQ
jgi:hypothetical protein